MTTTSIDYTPVTLYVPITGSLSLGNVLPGSALVSDGLANADRLTVDYEGNKYERPDVRFADLAHLAWGRHLRTERQPNRGATTARSRVPASELLVIGTYDPREGDVTYAEDHAARLAAAHWQGLIPDGEDRDDATLDGLLEPTRRTTGNSHHQSRRELRAHRAQNPGPVLPHVRDWARRMGHEDLLG